MKNYVLAFSAVILVIGICVLVIHYEAEQTRLSMRQVAHDELPNIVHGEVDDTIRAPGEKVQQANQASGGILDTLRSTIGGSKDDKPQAGKSERVEDDEKEADPAKQPNKRDGLLGQMRDTLGLPQDKSDKPDKSKPTQPADIVEGLFGVAREVVKGSDQSAQEYLMLSLDDERKWGRRIHDEIIKEKEVVNDSALHDRIDELAAPLLRARRRRGIDYTFTVLKSDPEDINAFSIAGGYVYVNRALVDYVKTDQELQFVVGHEIGHVDLGHCAQRLAYTARAADITPVGANIVGLVHDLLTRSYSQDQEYEADDYGFRAVIAAGQTRDQALEFPRRFRKWLKLRGDDQPAKTKKSDRTAVGTFAQQVNDHFRSHPYMDDRVQRLEAIKIDSKPAD